MSCPGVSVRGGPAPGRALSPRVVLESDPEEPDACPDVRRLRKRRRAPASGRRPHVAAPCPHPDSRGPKKPRFDPKTTPDPDVGRETAVPSAQPQTRSLNPKKVANPDVKRLAGRDPTLDVASDGYGEVTPKTAFFDPTCNRATLEVSRNPDVEATGSNPDVEGSGDPGGMLVVDSDTDVEDAEVRPDVECPRIHCMDPATPKRAEAETPNPDVGGPKNGCRTLVDSDTDVEMESSDLAVEGPKNGHRLLIVDSDTDVEEDGANPDVGCPETYQAIRNTQRTQIIEVETKNTDVAGSQKGHQAFVVDSDTDVEEDGANPDVGCPKPRLTTQDVPNPRNIEMETRNTDVAGSQKGHQALVVDSDTDVEEDGINPDVGCPVTHQATQNIKRTQIIGVETKNTDVAGSQKGHQALVVDSDTDVDEDGENPDVGCSETHQATQNIKRTQITEVETRNTDVAGSQKGHQAHVADSDTDVEEDGANPDVGCPETHRATQNIKRTQITEVETRNTDVAGSQKGHQAHVADSDTDVEEDGANPDVGCPETHRATQNIKRTQIMEAETGNTDVAGSQKGHQVHVADSDTDVEEDGANPDVGCPKTHQITQNIKETQIMEAETGNTDVAGSQKGHQVLVVDSDTDVEEDGANPDVVSPESPRAAPCDPDVRAEAADRGGAGRRTLLVESDTDVEEDGASPDVGTSKPHEGTRNLPKASCAEGSRNRRWTLAVDSDTDVEEEAEADPNIGCPKIQGIACGDPDVGVTIPNPDVSNPQKVPSQHVPLPESRKTPQNTRNDPTMVMETPNPDVTGLSFGSVASDGDSDTDVEDLDALPDAGAPKPPEVTATGAKMATAPDVDLNQPTRTNDNPDVKVMLPAPDVGIQEAKHLSLHSDADVEDDDGIPDVPRCRKASSHPSVATKSPYPDVSPPTSPGNGSDTDMEEVAPTPDVRSRIRPQNRPRPDVGGPQTDTDGDTGETDSKRRKPSPKQRSLSPKSPGDAGAEGGDPKDPGSAPNPDVGHTGETSARAQEPAVLPDVSAPESPGLAPGSGDAGVTPGRDTDAMVAESDSEEDPDLFLEPTQRFLPPVAEDTTPNWDPEEPTQPFFTPEEEEQPPTEPPQAPPEARSPPAEPVTVTPAQEVTGTGAAPGGEEGEGPRRSQRLARSRGGGAKEGGASVRGGVGRVKGGALPVPAPLRRSSRLQAQPPPPEQPAMRGRGQVEPRPLPKPRPHPPGPAPSKKQAQEEEPPEVTRPQLRPRAAPSSTPFKVLLTGVVASPGCPQGVPMSPGAAHGDGGLPMVSPCPQVLLTGVVASPGCCSRGWWPPQGVPMVSPCPQVLLTGVVASPGCPHGVPMVSSCPQVLFTGVVASPGCPHGVPMVSPGAAHGGGGLPHGVPMVSPCPQVLLTGVVASPGCPQGVPTSPAPCPQVLFTGVVASPDTEVALRTLGGSMATSVFDCTHLVTDRVRRTVKFLCAVARGVPIVTPQWLHESVGSGRVLAPGPFLVRDGQRERHFGFSLAQALRRARRHPLLQGYEVHVTPSVRPEPEHMRDIVTCSGGTFLPAMPHTYGPRRLVISCPADAGGWAPALGARLPLASAELLLTGVLRQRLQLQPFLLPPPGTPPRHPPAAPRNPPGRPRCDVTVALGTPGTPVGTSSRGRDT
ncbi:mediator of DNA damage checkpoint protein 1 [Rhynochetos jubatus]